jgi:hypothetical protein
MKERTQKILKTIKENILDEERSRLLSELVTKLSERLEATPASTAVRYHHAYDGGLLDHIQEVFEIGWQISGGINSNHAVISRDSVLTVAILHDIGKIGDSKGNAQYVPNVSEKTGKRSEAEPFRIEKTSLRKFEEEAEKNPELRVLLPFLDTSDGENSLALLSVVGPELLASLTPSEINAIQYHDGGYGKAKYASGYRGKEDALAILIHAADMLSARKRNWEKGAI